MDIDHIIKTRDYILLSDVLKVNKNTRIISENVHSVVYEYNRQIETSYESRIEVSLIFHTIENSGNVIRYDFYLPLILILESSNTCRQRLKQKCYDRISLYVAPYLLAALNFIIIENDMGIIIKK